MREFAAGWPIGSLAVLPTQLATILLADSDSGGGGGAIAQLGILLLIPFAMYFFLIRPQRRRAHEQQDVQKAIEIGDEIVTTSMFGRITGEDGPLRFWIEVDDDVQIRIARAAIQGKVGDEDEDKAGTAPAKGDVADSADPDLDS